MSARPYRWLDELWAPLPLAAVALFALNNHWLKSAWGGPVTGKLSDMLACFFLPLLLAGVVWWPGSRPERRVVVGAVITAAVFCAVQLSSAASDALVALSSALLPSAWGPSVNTPDPTDLMALPMCALAVVYARRRFNDAGRPKAAPFAARAG